MTNLVVGAALLAMLAGCSRGPDWFLLDDRDIRSSYVDRRTLRKDGELVHATIRSVYKREMSTPLAAKPYWSTLSDIVINCEARSWAEPRFEAFDKGGESVGTRFGATPLAFTSYADDWHHPRLAPRRLCDHLNAGAPLD